MGKFAWISLVLLIACGEARDADPPAAALAPDDGDRVARPGPPPDPRAVCRELAEALGQMLAIVDDAEAVPRDRHLYELAARLSVTRREIEIARHELAILEAEAAAPDHVLAPERYRALRREEHARVEAALVEAIAAEAALRDEAARSVHPKVAAPDGPIFVLLSIRWRDAAAHVRRYAEGCKAAPDAVDGAALRDFVSAMTMLEQDTHDIGIRALEQRLLAGDDLAARVP